MPDAWVNLGSPAYAADMLLNELPHTDDYNGEEVFVLFLWTDYSNTTTDFRKGQFHQHNMKLKPRKCQRFKGEVELLGKLVSDNGISIVLGVFQNTRKDTRENLSLQLT